MRSLIIIIFGLLLQQVAICQSPENARATQIFSVGLTVGFAEYGALKGDKPGFLAEKLQYAIDNAEATGCIPTARLKELRRKMLNTSNSNSLYKEIEAYRRDVLAFEIMEYCSCNVDKTPPSDNTDVITSGSGVTLTLDKSSYTTTDKITVSFSGMAGNSSDWIALTLKSKPSSTYDVYKYTGGKESGSITFDALKQGEYEARAYFNNNYTLIAKSVPFTVIVGSIGTGSDPTNDNSNTEVRLTLNKSSYAVNEKITVTFSGMKGTTSDWIALTEKSKPSSTYDVYKYLGGKKSGSITFDGLKAGEYEARAYFDNNYFLKGKSGVFSVGGSGNSNTNDTNTGSTTGVTGTDLGEISWSKRPIDFSLRGKNNEVFCFTCTEFKNDAYSVYGTDIYTDDSSICLAAKHVGIIDDNGGDVCIRILPKHSQYISTERNGLTTRSYGSWPGSFEIVVVGSSGNNILPPDNPFVQLGPPSGDMSSWKVDYGSFDAKKEEINSTPSADGYTSYYIAPDNFKGNLTAYRTLNFYKKSWGGSYYGPDSHGAKGDIVIKNGKMTARFDISKDHAKTWKYYTVNLSGSGWKLSGGATTLSDVLKNVTEFKIRAEYGAGTDYSALKAVLLSK